MTVSLTSFHREAFLKNQGRRRYVGFGCVMDWCVSDFPVNYYLEINPGVSFVSVTGSIDLTFETLPCSTLKVLLKLSSEEHSAGRQGRGH